MFGYIYITTNTVNGKKYIGKHKSAEFDFDKYKGSGKTLRKAFKKYGFENFTCELLEEINGIKTICETEDELNNSEKYYVSYYNCVESDDYYNLRCGGEGGDTVKKLSKEEMALRSSRIRSYGIGTVWISNDQLRKTIRIKRDASEKYIQDGWYFGYVYHKPQNMDSGWIEARSEKVRKKIPKDVMDGIVFDYKSGLSCRECSEKYNVSISIIYRYIKKNKILEKRDNSFYLKINDHRNKFIENLKKSLSVNRKPIQRTEEWNRKIRESNIKSKGVHVHCIDLDIYFNSISDANAYFGKNRRLDCISRCCKGKQKTAFGHMWEFSDK